MAMDPVPSGRAPSEFAPPDLSIDEDGAWLDHGVEVTHPGVLANLRGNLRRDADGYFIQTRVRVPVRVADVPWVVVRLERRDDRLHARLNDGTDTVIDPATLFIGPANVPYCTAVAVAPPVNDGRFEARLSRPATFQLLALVELDPTVGEVLKLGRGTWPLRRPA